MSAATRQVRRIAAGLAGLVLVVGTAGAAGAQSAASQEPPAPPRDRGNSPAVVGVDRGRPVAGRYIVVFRKGASPADVRAARDEARGRGAQVHHDYQHALRGFAASLPAQALDGLRRNPRVDFIEQDAVVTATDTQAGATWGLDRIDQRALPLGQAYTYNATGAGVKAYIVDTGIRTTHVEFGGRAGGGYTAVADGRGVQDCQGHGTHVAGTVGGATSGVAKQVSLVPVRVLDCTGAGTNSGVIAGIDWVTADHAAGQPAVANLSLGGPASRALDTAVSNSIYDGVTFAVAAGNENADACGVSPARVPDAVTVGATTSSDTRSSFSNYGTCLDLFAPGSSITSAYHTGDTALAIMSGTSMATPHAAGVAALYLQGAPAATPATVRNAIVDSTTTNAVSGAGAGSPNRLLYSLFGATAPPTTTGCSLPESYTGSLPGTGAGAYQPNGSYYYANAGTHTGCLRGPSGADFDLYLLRWNGSTWVTVAQGIKTGSAEDIAYNGTAGYYTWRVESYSGSGSYTFGLKRP
ncbi:MAG TPA: S8 family serine peptidase [Acidimicrobiales bacterium]|nr:S8 family serine peptidase [Acidimicrobiales bacterium]